VSGRVTVRNGVASDEVRAAYAVGLGTFDANAEWQTHEFKGVVWRLLASTERGKPA
jgi:hypothetical protein